VFTPQEDGLNKFSGKGTLEPPRSSVPPNYASVILVTEATISDTSLPNRSMLSRVASDLRGGASMTDDDPRLVFWCRMGLLSGALLNWFAAAMLLWDHAHATTPFTNLSLRP
jgi:hypothetical protein